jgi:hypothetical protein
VHRLVPQPTPTQGSPFPQHRRLMFFLSKVMPFHASFERQSARCCVFDSSIEVAMAFQLCLYSGHQDSATIGRPLCILSCHRLSDSACRRGTGAKCGRARQSGSIATMQSRGGGTVRPLVASRRWLAAHGGLSSVRTFCLPASTQLLLARHGLPLSAAPSPPTRASLNSILTALS